MAEVGDWHVTVAYQGCRWLSSRLFPGFLTLFWQLRQLTQACISLLPSLPSPRCRPLGYCMRVREAVLDLARGLLRACEEATLLAQPPLVDAGGSAVGVGSGFAGDTVDGGAVRLH